MSDSPTPGFSARSGTNRTLRALPLATVFAVLVSFPASALAQGAPLSSVTLGDILYVTDAGGREIRGRAATVGPASLTLRIGDNLRSLPMDQISVIERLRRDSVKNGVGIGMLAGGGGMLAGILATCKGKSDCIDGEGVALLMLGGMGIGAGIGAVVDLLIQDRETILSEPFGDLPAGERFSNTVRGAPRRLRGSAVLRRRDVLGR